MDEVGSHILKNTLLVTSTLKKSTKNQFGRHLNEKVISGERPSIQTRNIHPQIPSIGYPLKKLELINLKKGGGEERDKK